MGKGTDKLYITHSEWSSSEAFSASVGAGASKSQREASGASFKKLPFNFCAASLQPFSNPVCTPDGTIFDAEVIAAWLDKRKTNPVDGKPLASKDLIKLNFSRNADEGIDASRNRNGGGDPEGDLIDPVSYKVFTDNTHIVAIRHNTYANVFAWDTVNRMNIKAKSWRDLLDDAPFTRADIITLQDPQHAEARNLSQFKYLKDGEAALLTPAQVEEREGSNVNAAALGSMGAKVLRAKQAVEQARKRREAGDNINKASSQALTTTRTGAIIPKPRVSQLQSVHDTGKRTASYNAAIYTTGRAAASLTSTGLTPSTAIDHATLTDEQYLLHPRRVKIKGYARIETNHGDITLELHPEHAPRAVWNFVRLAQKGYYNDVPFHRNIPGFMIQGGDPSGTGKGGASIWGKNFKDEIEGPLCHDKRGMLCMANKGKDTNGSQFFILYKPAPHLDRKHTVFGRVVEGMDVLGRMEQVEGDGSNRPVRKILMREVVVFVDPFEEFMKERGEKESAEEGKRKREAEGGVEGDWVTWTGKRVGEAKKLGGGGDGEGAEGVGKYLREAMKRDCGGENGKKGEGGDGGLAQAQVDTWEGHGMEQPKKKKFKGGGFGNFDGW